MIQGNFSEIRKLLINEYEANPQKWYAEEDRVRVLIADDDQETRESLQELLSHQPDFEVIGVVSNGREAVEFVKSDHPDVILMDDDMPEMDGFEATRQITSVNDSIAVCTISTSSKAENMQKSMLSGARFYLTKLVKEEQLVVTVRIVAHQYNHVRTDVWKIKKQPDVISYTQLSSLSRNPINLNSN